jgi:hypothetical protein
LLAPAARQLFEQLGVGRSLFDGMASNKKITRLDDAITQVSDPAESQCELLREHLESARTSLLGEMQEEYALQLRLASEVLNCIADRERRDRVQKLIGELQRAKE